MIWSKNIFLKKCVFWPFLKPILAILCVKWAQMATFGGPEGSKISFSGSKLTQDPMNNVFEQKNFLAEKNFRPPGPLTEKIFGPGPARPGQAAGEPKGGPDRSIGVSNLSKTVGHPQKYKI